jgi:coenzyme Q-binding protein COQ10
MTEHPLRDWTEVYLTIDFQFSNPIYAVLSKAVTPKVASVMIEAFEIRASRLLDGSGSAMQKEHPLNSAFNAEKKLGV